MKDQNSSTSLPISIWALTFCAFGIGTTEFVIVGLLPSIAKDLSITVSNAGLLVTLFAVGVAIGGPIFTAVFGKIERKKLLLYTIAIFSLGNLLGYFADNVSMLQMSRVITGTTHGIFFANAVIIASNMVGKDKKATAISLVFAGLLVSTATGVPLGTYIGILYGWKITFLAVAIWGILGLIILALLLPKQIILTKALSLKELPKVLKNKDVLLVLSANILAYTGTFITFTYLSLLLHDISKFSTSAISWILMIYGIGVALGNIVGGRISNHKPAKVLVFLLLFHTIILFALYFVLPYQIMVIITLFLFGFFAFSNVPALQLMVVQLSEKKFPGSEGIASSLNVSAFNIGAALGSLIGGFVVESSFELKSTPIFGGVFIVVALVLAVVNCKKYGANQLTL